MKITGKKMQKILNTAEEPTISSVADIRISNGHMGKFICFNNLIDGQEHFAITFEGTDVVDTPMVRLHSECITGDVFGSARCDCGKQLNEAVNIISKHGGCILYLRQEGRGIGLKAKLASYELQDSGLNTYEANLKLGHPEDTRDYTAAVQMLHLLKFKKIKLLTNNPVKFDFIRESDIEVTDRISTSKFVNAHNKKYIESKITIGGHLFEE